MEKVTSPDVRWYGAARVPYTPLGTQRLPRPGWKNDTLGIADGVTGVILQDSSVAHVDAADYQRLRECGWVARWTSKKVTGNNFYPSINHGDRIRVVSRIILNAGEDEKVKYRDGNQLNLTRANLILRAKGGKEIDGSNRRAPMAPVLGNAENRRSAARVSASVGNASPAERAATASQAVAKAITQPLAFLPKDAA
jgi:hypothetical protein